MKKFSTRIISVFLCLTLMFTGSAINTTAADEVAWQESFVDTAEKFGYNCLNLIANTILKVVRSIYPTPPSWQHIFEYDSDEVGFMNGRDTYQTQAHRDAYWSLGYSSRTLVPDDITSGKYYIGRDMTNRMAKDIYDDMRVRVAAIDDNSGEGMVIIGSVDCLGLTSTDVRTMRKAILEYANSKSIRVSSINFFATHNHTALDTQGVGTELGKKLFFNLFYNFLGIDSEIPGMKVATYYKNFFIEESVKASIEAIEDMQPGKLYFSEIDTSDITYDKRGLIDSDDLQDMAVLRFDPLDESQEETFIADISCHATIFSDSVGYASGDYIYYTDEYIRLHSDNANFIMIAGAIGEIYKSFEVLVGDQSEYENYGDESRGVGYKFGERILSGDYSEELAPIINARHKEVFLEPENDLLLFACKAKGVNNKLYYDYDGTMFKKYYLPTEIGYLEFGGKVGFALFPGELYPEVFLGNEITGGATWDGTEWPYDSLANSVDGIKVYCVSLSNDAIGYAIVDNNFAFLGHVLGENGVGDELLSVGKHVASSYVTSYYELIDGYVE